MSRMQAIATLDGERCSASLAPLLANERVFVNIAVVRADGQLFCSAAPAKLPIDLSDRAFFQNALRTGGLGVGDLAPRVLGRSALGQVRTRGGNCSGDVSLGGGLQRQLEDLPRPRALRSRDRSQGTRSGPPDRRRQLAAVRLDAHHRHRARTAG
jgi:hypothetical protein